MAAKSKSSKHSDVESCADIDNEILEQLKKIINIQTEHTLILKKISEKKSGNRPPGKTTSTFNWFREELPKNNDLFQIIVKGKEYTKDGELSSGIWPYDSVDMGKVPDAVKKGKNTSAVRKTFAGWYWKEFIKTSQDYKNKMEELRASIEDSYIPTVKNSRKCSLLSDIDDLDVRSPANKKKPAAKKNAPKKGKPREKVSLEDSDSQSIDSNS